MRNLCIFQEGLWSSKACVCGDEAAVAACYAVEPMVLATQVQEVPAAYWSMHMPYNTAVCCRSC
jgi:hypothetical protein